jgi:cytochrome oxidase Cu insertion factor (SCO1/SenC/PrrC family)
VKAFLSEFEAPITGLTTDPDTLGALADEFGVLIRRSRGQSALAYVKHSSLIYLLDPRGELRRFYTADASAEAIAGELAPLLPVAPASSASTVAESHHHHQHQH